MAYVRKTKISPEDVSAPSTQVDMADHFLEAAKIGEQHIADVSRGGALPTANEIVAGLHAVGGALHERLMDLAQTPEDKQAIIDGTVTIFGGIADQRLRYHQDEKDAYVIQTDVTNNNRLEKTVTEAQTTIRRTAICYGLVSGLARAAAEAIRDERNA